MKLLFLDHGLNLELALLLGRAGHHVAYHVSPVNKHSLHDVALMGRGFESFGVHKIESWVGLTDTVDMICSPDCHLGAEVDWLRARGKKVWGAGSTATQLENDRWFAAKTEEKANLPTTRVTKVVGVPKLIEVLQALGKNETYVKCSGFRGVETFKHEDWTSTQEQFIAPLLQAYGADPELEFVLYPPIDPAQEVGADNIVIKGNMCNITPYGYEDKDTAYLGCLSRSLPASLQLINSAVLPYLKGQSTFFSTEARVVPSGAGYPIDLTMRAAHPPMAGLMVAIPSLANVITDGMEVRNSHPYVAVLVGDCGWAEEHPVEVEFEDRIRPYVKFAKAQCREGKRYFTVPSSSFPVQVIGVGSSPADACKMCKFNAEKVKGKDLSFDYASFDKLLNETIPQGRKYGIAF